MEVTDAQLQAWLQIGFWPLVRIGGVLMAAPVIGERATPARIRILLALALTLLLAPLLPTPPMLTPFTADWWLRTAQELLLGIMLGFVLKLVFEAAVLGGEIIGYGMGLGFAQLNDPVRGVNSPVIGQFFYMLVALIFFASGGHLRLIEALANSFTTAPVGGEALSASRFFAIAGFAKETFAGGLAIAMPTMAALLLVNVAFGVVSRSAPTLNGLSVGFPLSLIVGLVLIGIDMPTLRLVFEGVLRSGWGLIDSLGARP